MTHIELQTLLNLNLDKAYTNDKCKAIVGYMTHNNPTNFKVTIMLVTQDRTKPLDMTLISKTIDNYVLISPQIKRFTSDDYAVINALIPVIFKPFEDEHS